MASGPAGAGCGAPASPFGIPVGEGFGCRGGRPGRRRLRPRKPARQPLEERRQGRRSRRGGQRRQGRSEQQQGDQGEGQGPSAGGAQHGVSFLTGTDVPRRPGVGGGRSPPREVGEEGSTGTGGWAESVVTWDRKEVPEPACGAVWADSGPKLRVTRAPGPGGLERMPAAAATGAGGLGSGRGGEARRRAASRRTRPPPGAGGSWRAGPRSSGPPLPPGPGAGGP